VTQLHGYECGNDNSNDRQSPASHPIAGNDARDHQNEKEYRDAVRKKTGDSSDFCAIGRYEIQLNEIEAV
jgi:hypothetical protein